MFRSISKKMVTITDVLVLMAVFVVIALGEKMQKRRNKEPNSILLYAKKYKWG